MNEKWETIQKILILLHERQIYLEHWRDSMDNATLRDYADAMINEDCQIKRGVLDLFGGETTDYGWAKEIISEETMSNGMMCQTVKVYAPENKEIHDLVQRGFSLHS